MNKVYEHEQNGRRMRAEAYSGDDADGVAGVRLILDAAGVAAVSHRLTPEEFDEFVESVQRGLSADTHWTTPDAKGIQPEAT